MSTEVILTETTFANLSCCGFIQMAYYTSHLSIAPSLLLVVLALFARLDSKEFTPLSRTEAEQQLREEQKKKIPDFQDLFAFPRIVITFSFDSN